MRFREPPKREGDLRNAERATEGSLRNTRVFSLQQFL